MMSQLIYQLDIHALKVNDDRTISLKFIEYLDMLPLVLITVEPLIIFLFFLDT